MDFLAQFLDAMQRAGLAPADAKQVRADGKLFRYDVAGDRPRSGNGWGVLHANGEFAAGSFNSWKSAGEPIKWNSAGEGAKITDKQREYIRRADEGRRQAEKERADRVAARATEIWNAAKPASADHPYLKRKGVKPWNLRQDESGNLIVAVRSGSGIRSLQSISEEGRKRFVFGGQTAGCYTSLGATSSSVLVTEGWATAATLHEATGLAVVIAFNAGNLPAVARAVRQKYPDAEIIIAADNDHATEGNPGLKKATEAAMLVEAKVSAPSGIKGTDWNDYAAERGMDAVRQAFVKPAPALPPAPSPSPRSAALSDDAFMPGGAPIALGYNQDTYYYFSQEQRQVIVLTASEHTEPRLKSLASETYYWASSRFHNDKTGVNYRQAADDLMLQCKTAGIYDVERERGRGAWFDAGRSVIHLGSTLIVDGKQTPTTGLKSRFLYPVNLPLIDTVPQALATERGRALIQICESLKWENPVYGRLLAGWIATAPICGGVKFRSSVWVSGSAGSGKTTVEQDIVGRALGRIAIRSQGASSEAGIRRKLRSDALPVVFDEVDPENERSREQIQAILQLMRSASAEGGAEIFKADTGRGSGTVSYNIRSSFFFASINVAAKEYADQTRLSVLKLVKPDRSTPDAERAAGEHYARLMDQIFTTITDDFPAALMARSAKLLPVIRKNCETFSRAATAHLRNKRTGDQIATLLAGAYSLEREDEITYEAALQYMRSQTWTDSTSADLDEDDVRMLQHIRQSVIRVNMPQGAARDALVVELMRAAMGTDADVPIDTAISHLGRYGIRHDRGGEPQSKHENIRGELEGFWFSTSHQGLRRLMKGKNWENNWGDVLRRAKGAAYSGTDSVRFAGGDKTKAVFLPLETVFGGRG